ncbi:hypothetical protein EVJ58_g1233 [Rhodofomes roseus]|uniref:F-box domain-containing protein n=1 Tax=Rhodofomes roseus TaxID=34475 RepID=A0A4Y9Z0C9_9APHY|nr:hypothetical protein EVJ58_g1233 [Rhodofomes roseus]
MSDLSSAKVSSDRDTRSLTAEPCLPLEVQERILDFVAGSMDSRETMKACMQTCKGWTPRCRFHLLHEIHLRGQQEVFSFGRLLDSNPRYRNEVVYAHIGSRDGSLQPIAYVESFAARFAGKLPSVHHLMIRNAEMKSTNLRQDAYLHFSSFASLSELSLVRVTFRTRSMFVRIACSFPGLTLLQCTDVEIPGPNHQSTVITPVLRPNIRHLGVDGDPSSIERVSHAFVNAILAVALRTLVVGYQTAVPLRDLTASVQWLLDAAGPSLRTFTCLIDEGGFKRDDRAGQYINFTPNTCLERIVLRIPIHKDPSLSWIPALLSSATFHEGGEVCLIFSVDARDDTPHVLRMLFTRLRQSIGFELEAILSRPGFTKLRKLSVELYIVPWNIGLSQLAWTEVVTAAMPRLQARGVLDPCMRVMSDYSPTDVGSLLRGGVSLIPGSSVAETLARIPSDDLHAER